ncbi:hypothetical protein DITRI_Ditri04bG0135400 [Diplodiscus trichospermus]
MDEARPQPVCAQEALELLNCVTQSPFDQEKCTRLLLSLRECVLSKNVKKFSLDGQDHHHRETDSRTIDQCLAHRVLKRCGKLVGERAGRGENLGKQERKDELEVDWPMARRTEVAANERGAFVGRTKAWVKFFSGGGIGMGEV